MLPNKYVSPKTLAGWSGASNPSLGGGGGVEISNSFNLTLTKDVRFTNSSSSFAFISKSAALGAIASAASTATVTFQVDTNLDGTYDFNGKPVILNGNGTFAASGTYEIGGVAPPGAAWRYLSTVINSGTVSDVSGSGQIVYFSTNAAGSGGVSAATVQAIVSTNQILLWHNNAYTIQTSLTGAVANAVSGDAVWLGPGTYTATNRIVCPTNFSLVGSGPSTLIVNAYTNFINVGNSTPLIPLKQGLKLANFAMTNIYPNRFQSFVGSFAVDGDVCFTDVLLQNLTGTHDVDWYYVLQTNNCAVRMENCNIRTKWDIWFVDNSGGRVTNTIVNCTFVARGPNSLIPAAPSRALLVGNGCTLFAYNSIWEADQANSVGLLAINSAIYCRFANSTVLSFGGTNVMNTFGVAAPIIFAGSYPNIAQSTGSAGSINTPPWDAFSVEAQSIIVTNIVSSIDATLRIKASGEFATEETLYTPEGHWSFPLTIAIGSTGAPPVNAVTPVTWFTISNAAKMYRVPGYQ